MKHIIDKSGFGQSYILPYAWELSTRLDNGLLPIKEFVLENANAKSQGICQMDINMTKLVAIDENEKEHDIITYKKPQVLSIKSMASSYFLKTKKLNTLKPSKYNTLRYYLDRKYNIFTYSDGEKVGVNTCDFIDFKIKNGLVIEEGDNFEAKFWFDLPSLKFSRHFKKFLDKFKSANSGKREVART